MGGTGRGNFTMGDINVTVDREEGEDSTELAAKISKSIEETLIGMVDTRIAENAQYGGALNPRGA
jgi:2,3-bisphosphoglycerate-independent phosphoglycerate mutase